jgi:hypothetical protein
VWLLLSASPRATTVIAPSFQELIAEAEIVFEGEVLDTRSRLTVEAGNETIVTDVSFRMIRALKGAPAPIVTLEFLGGVVGDHGYHVDGVPAFVRGDHDVIFAMTSQRFVSPLVRVMHGRVRIVKEGPGGQDIVRRFDGTPLRDVAALGVNERQPVLSQIPALSLPAFESAVATEVARQGAQKTFRR